jgi:hypothetical protein
MRNFGKSQTFSLKFRISRNINTKFPEHPNFRSTDDEQYILNFLFREMNKYLEVSIVH